MVEPVPRVTVCVPTIGRTEYLASTRASVEAQTFRDIEVLVLDNASPPASSALLEEWASRDARVRVLRCDPRIPMFENFNRGIAAARGTYLAFCHDDDTVSPHFVAQHVAFLDVHPTVGFSGSSYDVIDEDGRFVERRRAIGAAAVWDGRRYIRALIRSGRNPLTMQSIFYRRAALEPTGIDARLSLHWGDFVFLMRIAEKWDVGLLPDPLVSVRFHSAQASSALSLSRGIPLRSDMLGAYVAELGARHPAERRLVAQLRAALALSHRTGLLWGWLSAVSPEEARACADALGASVLDRAAGAVLHRVDHILPTTGQRRASLAATVRRLANGQGLRGTRT